MNDNKDGNDKDKEKKVLPFQVVDKRKADEPSENLGPPSTKEQEEIKQCWDEVGAILDKYNAQFMIDAPPVQLQVGDQIMTFQIPVKYGIRIKRG